MPPFQICIRTAPNGNIASRNGVLSKEAVLRNLGFSDVRCYEIACCGGCENYAARLLLREILAIAASSFLGFLSLLVFTLSVQFSVIEKKQTRILMGDY